jgi:alginate O-acetyltransferase complex protein AlgJ
MQVLASSNQDASATPTGAARWRTALFLSRLVLPVAFFGYGLVANLAIVLGDDAELAHPEGAVVQGEATAHLSAAYAKAMPHREPAVAWLGAARYALLGEGRDGVVVGRDGWLFTDEEMAAASESQVAQMVGEALAARDRLAALGSRLVVVVLPAKVDVERRHAPDARAAWAMEQQQQRFLLALGAAGVDAVDARPALVEADREFPAFWSRDTHWTPEGAAAVAQAVARSGLVDLGDDTFLRRDREPEEVQGDLVSFVTSRGLAPRLGLGPEPVVPYVAEAVGGAKGGIFAADAPQPSVLLVGTSYSADARWSFAPALALALGRDVADRAQEGQGPIRPLRALLADPALAQDPPDTVIWEIPVRYLGDPSIWPEAPQGSSGQGGQ